MKVEKFYSEAQFSAYVNHGLGSSGDRILIVPTGYTFEKNSTGMWIQIGRGTQREKFRRQKERNRKIDSQPELNYNDYKI